MQKTAGRLAHVVRSHGTVLSLRRRLGTAASQPDAGSVRDDVEPHDPAFMNFKDSRSAQLAAIGTDVHPYRDRDACAVVALRPVGLDINPEASFPASTSALRPVPPRRCPKRISELDIGSKQAYEHRLIALVESCRESPHHPDRIACHDSTLPQFREPSLRI
jgi:hypothetical protein